MIHVTYSSASGTGCHATLKCSPGPKALSLNSGLCGGNSASGPSHSSDLTLAEHQL